MPRRRLRRRAAIPGYCGECGEGVSLVSRPGPVARVRHYLVYGMPASAAWVCANGHQSDGHAGTTITLRRSRVPRVLSAPAQFASAVRRERTMEPVPLTYVLAAAVGLVFGIGLDLWLGWPWWLVAAGCVALVWLLFLSTALHKAGRVSLMQRFRFIRDPERAHRLELESVAARVDASAIAAYGVAEWPGRLGLGGWTGVDGEISSVRLAHYESPDAAAPAIEVEYHSGSRHFPRALAEQVREDFVVDSLPAEVAEHADLGRRMAQRRWAALQSPLPPWSESTIDVDGAPVTFAVVKRPGAFAAIAAVGAGYLVVQSGGHEPGSFSIARIADMGPYVSGTLEAMKRRE